MTKLHLLTTAFILIVLLFSCKGKHSKDEIVQAMRRYDRFILEMQVDSIANLYTPDGNLGGVAIGRDSIRALLHKFENIKVIFQESTTESINISADSATHTGSYRQTDILPQRDTVTVSGRFVVNWKWLEKGGWHIQKMTTIPDK